MLVRLVGRRLSRTLGSHLQSVSIRPTLRFGFTAESVKFLMHSRTYSRTDLSMCRLAGARVRGRNQGRREHARHRSAGQLSVSMRCRRPLRGCKLTRLVIRLPIRLVRSQLGPTLDHAGSRQSQGRRKESRVCKDRHPEQADLYVLSLTRSQMLPLVVSATLMIDRLVLVPQTRFQPASPSQYGMESGASSPPRRRWLSILGATVSDPIESPSAGCFRRC